VPTALPEEIGLSSARLDCLTRVLRDEIARGRLPGAVAADRAPRQDRLFRQLRPILLTQAPGQRERYRTLFRDMVYAAFGD
jgi:hypothetical protein